MIADRSMVCIDWDERSLRVLDGQFRRGGLKVRKAFHVPLPAQIDPRDPGEMGAFLKRALAEHRIRTRRAIVDVPRQEAVFTSMTLPRGSKEEIAAMVQVQAAKELPFAKDQAVVDFAMCAGAKEGMCEVWVAAVRTAVVERYRQTVANAGLKAERIGLRPYANAAALIPGQASTDRILMVDIGPSMTEISVIRDARLVYTRAAQVAVMTEPHHAEERRPSPDQTIPPADDSLPKQGPLDALLIEVSRTIQAYRASDAGARIDRIILSGTGGADERVRASFESRFGSPTRIFDAPSAVNWKRIADVSAAPFVAAIGLTYNHLANETERFDFLHPKEPEAERKERAKRRPLVALTVALFLAAGVVLAVQMLRKEQKEIDGIVAERQQIERQAKEYADLQKKHADINEWMRKNVVWIDKLKLVAENFVSNEKGYITDLQIKDPGEMIILLASKDNSVGTKLAEEIRKITTSRPASDGKVSTVTEFTAEVGSVKASKDPKYPFIDTVTVRVKSLAAAKRGRSSR